MPLAWIGSPYARRLRVESLEDRRLLAVMGFTGPYDLEGWIDSGIAGGTTSISSLSSATDDASFGYNVNLGSGGVSQRTADFTVASSPVTGSVRFNYQFAGNHAFFQANADFALLVGGSDTPIVAAAPTSGAFNFTGSAALVARQGQSFGFRIGGKNFDSFSQLVGTLTITNFQAFDSIVVDSAADTVDGNYSPGNLTLREAIGLANTIPGADVITFASGMSGQTILLGGASLDITEAVTIDAAPLAANVTIDAQQNSRVLLFSAATGDLTLSGLTMRNGRTTGIGNGNGGGGIRFLSSGTLTLSESTLTGNSTEGSQAGGGGIFTNSGNVTLNRSTLSGNTSTDGKGGGIYTDGGVVTLNQSTLSGNSTQNNFRNGGAIYSANRDVTLNQSTVSGNSTAGEGARGGAIYATNGRVTLNQSTLSGNSTAGNNAHGGGIYSRASFNAVTLNQSTVSGNRTTGEGARGGAIFAQGSSGVTLSQSTLTGNSTAGNNAHGGGIFTQSTFGAVTIRNSIVAGNTVAAGSTGPDLVFTPGKAVIVNFSVIGTGITPTAGGNNIVTNALLLGPLADNGGPTQTHALPSGSAAIDAGDPAVPFNAAEFDQRGAPFVRVFGGRLDIGAFEAIPLVVNNAGGGDDGNIANGVTTLREAINFANAASGADVITFAAGMSGQTILLGGTQLEITDALTIDAAPLAVNVTIDAQQQSRVIHFSNPNEDDLTLAGLTIQNGRTTGGIDHGGGIRFMSEGTLALTESTLSGNSTTGDNAAGGAIYSEHGVVALASSTLSGNSTAGSGAHGGGIFSGTGVVTLTNSTLSGNSTAGTSARGGGIYSEHGAVSLTSSTLSGNSTAGSGARGGGIYTDTGDVTLTNSTLSGNSTAENGADGGGISTDFGAVTLNQSTLSENSTVGTDADGGGIFTDFGNVTLNQSTLTGNSTAGASADGGGISTNFGAVTIRNSILAGNTVTVGSTGPDFVTDPQNTITVNFSVIGTGITPAAGGNNISTNNPKLGPLADNGGPTKTHALLPGSPALDAGDPTGIAVHIYELNNSLADALGGPALNEEGGALTPTGYQFGPNEGLDLSSAVAVGEYSIELVFSFDALGGYQKIIDFHNRVDDTGLYSTGPNLHFFDAAFADNVLTAGVPVHLVVTRDAATKATAVYANGVRVMNFVDVNDRALFNGPSQVIRFFQDDNVSGQSEAASGFVDRIRIFNRDLSAGEVAALVFDQRGEGFLRVVDGDGISGPAGAQPDIGAYEAQVKPSADFDGNTIVDGADLLRWQRGLGTPNATRAQGNSDGDADADLSDLAAWTSQFGATGVTSIEAAASGGSQSFSAAQHTADPRTAALDTVYAGGDFTSLFAERTAFRPQGKTRIRLSR